MRSNEFPRYRLSKNLGFVSNRLGSCYRSFCCVGPHSPAPGLDLVCMIRSVPSALIDGSWLDGPRILNRLSSQGVEERLLEFPARMGLCTPSFASIGGVYSPTHGTHAPTLCTDVSLTTRSIQHDVYGMLIFASWQNLFEVGAKIHTFSPYVVKFSTTVGAA
jgi:hypothetical protein